MAKRNFEDDGRVIADMNIEGMRGYRKQKPQQKSAGEGSPKAEGEIRYEELSFREKFAFLTGVVGAALLVAVIFIALFFLAILFTSKVWLH